MLQPLEPEPKIVRRFKKWLIKNGSRLHESVHFQRNPYGFSVVAARSVPGDATIVSVPFSLAITPLLALQALSDIFPPHARGLTGPLHKWSERQLICSYICAHRWFDKTNTPAVLRHRPYINMLPSPSMLRTSLHFTPAELELFRGSNLFGATVDRRATLEVEWQQCHALFSAVDPRWGSLFSWENYLTAATHLSSRAFPSSLLTSHPSLYSAPNTHPVLLPGIDSLNHERGHPVSWLVTDPSKTTNPTISLVLHKPTLIGSELFNNYGLKPNSELILGYGFSLFHNPDDTIILKIGGLKASSNNNGRGWEVGRHQKGIESVWQAVLGVVSSGKTEEDITIEDELCAADTLGEMARGLYARLPSGQVPSDQGIRPEVVIMLDHYLEGQRDILQSIIAFASENERRAMTLAKQQGLNIVEEGDEEAAPEDDEGNASSQEVEKILGD